MRRSVRRGLLAAAVVVVVGGAGFFGYYEAMKRAWIPVNQYDIRAEGVLRVGDPAPDLELRRVDGEASVRLSALYSRRPLALVFGSYT